MRTKYLFIIAAWLISLFIMYGILRAPAQVVPTNIDTLKAVQAQQQAVIDSLILRIAKGDSLLKKQQSYIFNDIPKKYHEIKHNISFLPFDSLCILLAINLSEKDCIGR